MKNWLRQHGLCFAGTLARFARTPLASVLNIGVIGVALASAVTLPAELVVMR